MGKNFQKGSTFPKVFENINPPTHTHTDTPTPTDVSTPTTSPAPVVKERKTRRVQLLMKESTVQSLDAYAKRYDTSRNDIIQNLVEDFLAKNGV